MMRCIQHDTVLSDRLLSSSLSLTSSLFLHLFPLLVPFLEVSFHVLFLFVSGSEPRSSGVTEGGVGVVEKREQSKCWTLGWVGGGLRVGLGMGVVGLFGWTKKRD